MTDQQRRQRLLTLVLSGTETPQELTAYEMLTDLYLAIKHAGGSLLFYGHKLLGADAAIAAWCNMERALV